MFEKTLDIALPEANVTVLPLALLLPSRARRPSTVMTSPTLTDSRVQPALLSSLVLANNTAQVVTAPFASVTSRSMRTLGLFHSYLVATPFSVTGFLSSKSASKAINGIPVRTVTAPSITQRNGFDFIYRPSSQNSSTGNSVLDPSRPQTLRHPP